MNNEEVKKELIEMINKIENFRVLQIVRKILKTILE